MNTETMTREQLEVEACEWATRNPLEMTREELARWNAVMSALDELNNPWDEE